MAHRRHEGDKTHLITETPCDVNAVSPLSGHRDRLVRFARIGDRRRRQRQDTVERLHRLTAGRQHLDPRVVREPGARRDQATDDHVFLQPAEVVGLAGDRGLRQHARGLLERSRRDEAVGRERRLRDAEEHGLGRRRALALRQHALVLLLEYELVDQLAHDELGVADLLDADAPEHLADDDLDVLVVDRHALQPIDLLHLVHEVALQLAIAEHREVVVRIGRPVHEGLAGLHAVALVNADVLAARDQVLLDLAVVGPDHDLAHALHEPAHLDPAVDLGDDGLLLGLARLEQLRDARQTARDVLGLGRLARDLGDDVGGVDLGAVRHAQVRAHRERVPVTLGGFHGRLALAGRANDDAGLELALRVLDDDLARQARDLVELLPHGHTLDDVLVLDPSRELGEDRVGERIPLDQHGPRLDLLVCLHLDLGAVDDRVALALAAAVVGHADLAVAVRRDQVAVGVHDGAQVVVLHDPRALGLVLRGLHDPARGAPDVEGPHRELRAGLADRLRGDDADRLTELGQPPGAQVAAVAHDADAALGIAGQGRPDPHALEARVLDLLRQLLGDLGVGLDDDLARERIADVFGGDTSKNAIAQRLDDIAALDQRCRIDVFDGAAVVLTDDDILRDVHESPSEIPGIGSFQRGVGQALARPVRRREVLEDGEALAEVRCNRRLDDLAARLGHEPAHAGQLPDLLFAAAGARVGHHVDRVELAALLAALQLSEHLLGDELGDVRPDVDHLVVPLAVRDHAVLVLLFHLVDLLARRGDLPFLRRRDVHVVDADREPRERRVAEAEILQLVQEVHRRLVAQGVVAPADQRRDLLLLELLVHEPQLLGHDLVQQRAPHGRLDDLAVPAQADAGLEVDVLVVVRDAHLFGIREEAALTPHRALRRAETLLGQVVNAEDHVLGRHRQRRAIRRRQDVVRGQHQHLGLELRLHRERDVHRHLVAVEVRGEGRADQRGNLDGLAFDEDRFERLDPQTVKGRSPIEENRVLLDDVFEDVPDLGTFLFHELLGRLDRRRDAAFLQLSQNKGLEELEGHLLGQAALVQLEVRTDHDDGPARVVHALAEEVLAEAALLALQGVGQRLERTIVGAGNDSPTTPIVEQRVDRFLKHPLLVADDDLGSLEIHEPLQPIVPVDDAAIEVVQIRRREPAAVEGYQRTELRRNDRHHLEDHPVGLVPRLQERLDDLEALHDLLPLLHGGLAEHLGAEVTRHRVEVHVAQELTDRLRAHADLQRVGTVLFLQLARLVDRHQVLLLDALQAAVEDDVLLEVEDLLQLAQRHVQELADPARQPLEEPDVGDRRGELDVAHPLAAHARPGHLDSALVADHAGELHPLVLAARALIVLRRSEDARAEQTVPLRLERPVIDRLRFLDFAMRPVADLLGRGQLDPDRVKRDGLRMPIEDAPKVLGWLVLSDQAAERPIRQHSHSPLGSLLPS